MPITSHTNAGHTNAARAALLAATATLLMAAPAAAQGLPTTYEANNRPTPVTADSRLYDVANRSELWSALLVARAGDTILLGPGHYGDFLFNRFRFTDGTVNIRSKLATDRARFGQINFGSATGIALSGVDAQSTKSPVVAIGGGSNIRLTGLKVRGAFPNQDAWDDAQTGMHIRSAADIMVISNDFQDLRAAIYVQRSDAVAIRSNSFSHLREGVNIATMTNSDISYNHFHTFQPNYGKGEHPDAIQFWNNGEPAGSSNVRVRQNFFSLTNPGAVHGIFIGLERQAYRHSNLEISGNVYYGSALHGITVTGTDGAKVFNNVAVGSPWADMNDSKLRTPDGRTGGAMQPQIRLVATTGGELMRNIATKTPSGPAGTVSADNINLYDTETRIGEAWDSVFQSPPSGTAPPVSAFVTRATSAAATRGIGLLAPFGPGVVTLDPAAAQTLGARHPRP